jgi:uncharacterized membrane protein
MISWIVLVVIAQFIYAIVAIIDKFIITSKTVSRPFVYAFYLSALSFLGISIFAFSFIQLPFETIQMPSISNVHFVTPLVALLTMLNAYTFFGALFFIFTAFKKADASDVVPVVGSIAAVTTLLLSFIFLDVFLSPNFILGFALLVTGTFLVSHFRFTGNTLKMAVLSGIFFGANAVSVKVLFGFTSFDNGFFWSRIAMIAAVLSLLLIPSLRSKLKGQVSKTGTKGSVFVLGNKFLSSISGIMILKAIQLGDVSIVQALAGLQFVFLLIFSVFLGHRTPKSCGENCQRRDRLQKLISVGIIVLGFVILFI